MINTTLTQLENWYNEPSAGPERPKLLSKLALLELCGWLECELDRIVLSVDNTCLKDPDWVKCQVIDRTFGFNYSKHFRPMLTELLGEHLTRRLEESMDRKFPGDLERLRSSTGDLWTKRCNFAHSDMAGNIQTQQRFDAPNWSQNQHRILSKILTRLEAEAKALAQNL